METPYSEVKMEAINNYKPTGKLRVRTTSSLLQANVTFTHGGSLCLLSRHLRFNSCLSIRDRS